MADVRVATSDPSGPASCSVCGASADAPPITWIKERDPRQGPVWICDRCARENLRGIESRLDREWW